MQLKIHVIQSIIEKKKQISVFLPFSLRKKPLSQQIKKY